MNWWQRDLLRSKPGRALVYWMKKTRMPGSGGLSLHEVGGFFVQEMIANKLSISSAATAYNFLMAIPPTLLVLFSLVPYLPLKGVQDTILETLRIVAPNQMYISLSTIITDIMNVERTGLLSFGLMLTIYFSSNGMMGLISSFERTLPIYVKRSHFRRRWTAIKLTLLLIGVVILSIAALIIQSRSLNDLLLIIFNNVLVIRITSLVIVVTVVLMAISVIYTYGPSLSQRFKFISPGSIFATVMSIITTTVFFFLANNFIHYNQVYGSIGTLMAFMVWLYLNTLVILFGYELNVSILLAQTSRKKHANKEPVAV